MDGQKFLIVRIYATPRAKYDGRQHEFCVPEELAHTAGVYAITDKDGNRYIGSTNNFKKRFREHFKDIRNPLFDNGGIFEILEVVTDLSQLRIKEQYYIDLYKE